MQPHTVFGAQLDLLVREPQARGSDLVRPHREVDEVLLQEQQQTPRKEQQGEDPERQPRRRPPAHGRIIARRGHAKRGVG